MKKVILMFILLSSTIFCQNYHIGDKITLEITTPLTEQEVRDCFKDYTVYKLKPRKNGYQIIFTTFKVGENKINLDDNVISFMVDSTISKDKDLKIKNTLFDSSNKYIIKDYPYLTVLFFILAILFTTIATRMWIIDYRNKPYNKFLKRMEEVDSDNWRERISFCIRSYVDEAFKLKYLKGIYDVTDILNENRVNFIKKLDCLKFSNMVEDEEYKTTKDEAYKLVEELEQERRLKKEVRKKDV